MANSNDVRAWAAEQGLAKANSRGRLSFEAIEKFNAAHPDNVYDVSENVPVQTLYVPKVFGTKSGKLPKGKTWEKTVTVSDVRTWGREHGFTVGARGRLHPELKSAYLKAHKSVKVATA